MNSNGWTSTSIGLSGMSQSAYHCRICDKWFLRGNVSCCVYHADGHCHYGDTEITMGEAYRIVAPRQDEDALGGSATIRGGNGTALDALKGTRMTIAPRLPQPDKGERE